MLLINDYINMIYEIVKLKLINDLLKKSLLILIRLKINMNDNLNENFIYFFVVLKFCVTWFHCQICDFDLFINNIKRNNLKRS